MLRHAHDHGLQPPAGARGHAEDERDGTARGRAVRQDGPTAQALGGAGHGVRWRRELEKLLKDFAVLAKFGYFCIEERAKLEPEPEEDKKEEDKKEEDKPETPREEHKKGEDKKEIGSLWRADWDCVRPIQ